MEQASYLVKKPKLKKKKSLTKRGVVWLGQTCNLRCFFCYFLNKVANAQHPQHAFMSLEKAKAVCKTLVEHYGNNAIDIQGGEPTIYKHINELVAYCRTIGLLPTLITNAIVLDDIDKCKKLKEAGLRDLLVSIQGLDNVYACNTGLEGGSARQMKALDNINQLGIPFRINTVLNTSTLPQLTDIARLAIERGARAMNMIAFNPFGDQMNAGVRTDKNVPRYSEAVPFVQEVIDMLDKEGIEVNTRYFPPCIFEEKYRKYIYNFQQNPYDDHEWDLASWTWTFTDEVLTKDLKLIPPISMDLYGLGRYHNGYVEDWNGNMLQNGKSRIQKLMHWSLGNPSARNISFEKAIQLNAKQRSIVHLKYQYSQLCNSCSIKYICDGFHGDYAELFGTNEASPIQLGKDINRPDFYIQHQLKVDDSELY